MGESQIHEAVFVEVECDHARRRRREGGVPRFGLAERPFPGIQKHHGRALPASKDQIDRAIVVQIRGERGDSGRVAGQSGLGCPICECSIAIVAPERIRRRRRCERKVEFTVRLNWEIGEA